MRMPSIPEVDRENLSPPGGDRCGSGSTDVDDSMWWYPEVGGGLVAVIHRVHEHRHAVPHLTCCGVNFMASVLLAPPEQVGT